MLTERTVHKVHVKRTYST